MKSLLILYSYHHKNTEKIANVFAKVLDTQIKTPQQINPQELQEYSLIGFGSGIYSDKHHKVMLDFADELPQVNNKKAFIFSTCGAPMKFMELDKTEFTRYVAKNHSSLKEKLQSKGYMIVDEFQCKGFFGIIGLGLNRSRPNAEDLKHAKEFAQNITAGQKKDLKS